MPTKNIDDITNNVSMTEQEIEGILCQLYIITLNTKQNKSKNMMI